MFSKTDYAEAESKFLESENLKAWETMWLIAYDVTARLLYKEMRKKKLCFTAEKIEDLKDVAVEYVLRRYRTTPGYKVKNIVAAMHDGILHALYYRSPAQKLYDDAITLVMQNKTITLDAALNLLTGNKVEKLRNKKIEEEKAQGQLFFDF